MFIRSIIRLLVILAPTLSFALSQQITTIDRTYFFELYQEQGLWIVETFEIQEGKLQDKIERLTFEFEAEAYQALNQKKQKLLPISTKNIFSLVSTESTGSIWEAKHEWNDEWEKKYSEWIASLPLTFFEDYKVKTDCADAAYALRWIFARIHALPVGGTLAGSNILFTHETMRTSWASLPTHKNWFEDKRFLKALDYLLDNTYTKTMYIDGYPLKISQVKPGTVNLLGGHTEIVHQLIDDGKNIPITLMSSTVPRALRTLHSRVFVDSNPIDKALGGLLQFRYLIKKNNAWSLIPKNKMPHYSLEQYDSDLCSSTSHFALCVYEKLKLKFDPIVSVDSLFESLISTIDQRKTIIQNGYTFCQKNPCSEGTMGYEDWSTPSRDKRLLASYNDTKSTISTLSQLSPDIEEYAEEKWKTTLIFSDLNLASFFKRLQSELVSYDPNDPVASRWAQNFEAIDFYLNKKLSSLLVKRNQIINRNLCSTKKLGCEPNTSMFKASNTLELDHKLRTILKGFAYFCQEEICPAESEENILRRYQYFWTMSSLPWEQLNARQGVHLSKDAYHVFYTNQYSLQLLDNWLVLADKLYQFPEMTPFPSPIGSVVRINGKHIYAVSSQRFYYFNGNQFVELIQSAHPVGLTVNFLENYAFIQAQGENNHSYIVNLKDQSIHSQKNGYFNVDFFQDQSGIILTNIENNQREIFYTKNDELKSFYMTEQDSVFGYYVQSEDGWIIGTYEHRQGTTYYATKLITPNGSTTINDYTSEQYFSYSRKMGYLIETKFATNSNSSSHTKLTFEPDGSITNYPYNLWVRYFEPSMTKVPFLLGEGFNQTHLLFKDKEVSFSNDDKAILDVTKTHLLIYDFKQLKFRKTNFSLNDLESNHPHFFQRSCLSTCVSSSDNFSTEGVYSLNADSSLELIESLYLNQTFISSRIILQGSDSGIFPLSLNENTLSPPNKGAFFSPMDGVMLYVKKD